MRQDVAFVGTEKASEGGDRVAFGSAITSPIRVKRHGRKLSEIEVAKHGILL
jgi:hypothetical protein